MSKSDDTYEVQLKEVIKKINNFRQEALEVATKDYEVRNFEAFYGVLQKYCYFNNSYGGTSAIFLDIIYLLRNEIVKHLHSSGLGSPDFTFWFNYNAKYFSDERLGRIINNQEVAYRICGDEKPEILKSNNKNDYNAYYFRRVIGEGRDNDCDVLSVQEILSRNSDIELIKAFKIGENIGWEIKRYENDSLELYADTDTILDARPTAELLGMIFDNEEQFNIYLYFLKSTFGIKIKESGELSYLSYLSDLDNPDVFNTEDARYIPDVLYMCNLSAPYSSKENYSGSIMFASDCEISSDVLAREINSVKNIVGLITDIEAQYLHIKHKQQLLRESIKSAKSAIMSRNMSHNLGSHVMSYLKQHLSSVTTMMRDNVLHEIISYGTEDSLPSWNKTISKDSVNENIALPFLVGIGHFVSYLQERQDFIATIATDYIPYNSSVNFKDNVYDELNPDKRYERHSERSNMKIDNILLGNIARSEGLGRHTSPTIGEGSKLCDIVLKFGDFDGGLRSSEKDLGRLRDFDVSLPGGIVGRQAIFSIFENVIRNAAKHGNWKSSGKLELTIDYYSKNTINTAPDTDQYSDKEHKGCYSLRKVLTDFYAEAQDGEDLYFVTITDNSETDIEHLAKLRKSLCDSYLKNANKGLKEMRISASWLRSINDEDGCYNPYLPYLNDDELLSSDLFAVNDKKLKAPILYARLSVPGMFLPPNLQYIFCLPIPREVALITSEHSDIDWKTRMINCNWRVFTENESVHEFLNQELNKSFDFILCDTKDMYDIIRPYTSAKTFYLSDPQLKFTLEQFKEDVIDKDSILEALYRRISGNTNGEIIMIDDSTVFINAKQLYEEGKCEKFSVIAEDSDKEPYNIKKITIHHKGKKEGSENTDVVEIEQELRKEEFVGFPHGTYYKVGPIVVGNAVKPVYTKYMYRTHHEAWEQFIGFMGNSSGYDVKYVEGITGNNATDRLVRHDPLTMKWYYSHIHSMKQSVAIIDERIFYKIYGIDEASFVRGKAYVSKIDSSSKETDRINDLNNARTYYKSILPEESHNRIEDASDMNTLQSIVSDDYAATIRCNAVYSKGYQGYTYFQKNIMVYTFIPAVEPHKFELVGINIKNRKPEINESFECVCVPIAVLSWDGKDFKVDSLSIETKFDFITIHQGLLDKLYEAFDIKEDVNAKNKIVAGLYKSFSSHTEGEIINNNFYPGFFIHSGRSKPGVEVMSQKVPFIQYATLEHAVLDCKYSLIELLDNARYE